MKTTDQIILLADDDIDDRAIINEIFSAHSKDIFILNVSDGEEVIYRLDELASYNLRPCLIILDVNMPKIDGKQTLKLIRQRPDVKNCQVVLFSTASDTRNEQFAKDHNADYIVKPFSYSKMESVVKQFISRCNATAG